MRELSNQLKDLLKANQELREENEYLRKIYWIEKIKIFPNDSINDKLILLFQVVSVEFRIVVRVVIVSVVDSGVDNNDEVVGIVVVVVATLLLGKNGWLRIILIGINTRTIPNKNANIICTTLYRYCFNCSFNFTFSLFSYNKCKNFSLVGEETLLGILKEGE